MLRAALAVGASFLVMFLLSGLFNVVLMADFVEKNAPPILRESPLMGFIFAAYVVLATLLVVLIRTSRFRGSPGAKGAKCGVLAGLFWMLPGQLLGHGVLEISILPLIVDSSWAVVEVGVGGFVAGLVLGDANNSSDVRVEIES